MSVIQNEDLVAYQLRCGYLTEIADGVGERLITLNDGFMNSAAFKAVGWQGNPDLPKRCYSPPIPTAVAAEYFQAPRPSGVTLEDEPDDTGMLTAGGTDTFGPGLATRRRRRRETLEDDDSSDLSDESDDDDPNQRPAQQIRFARMPVRPRAGSSPIQSSNLRQASNMTSPRAAPGARRGSQSALEVVKERARRDTVTSSEVSSENEFDASAFHRHREAAKAATKAARLQAKINEEPTEGVQRVGTDLLPEEEDEDDDSDASDLSVAFLESIDSTGLLNAVRHPDQASPDRQVVGTPPRQFTRSSTVRKSQAPPRVLQALPPPRPMSMIRPVSMIQPKGLLSAAFNARKTKPTIPFEAFATLSGQGENNPISTRIYPAYSNAPGKHYEVIIRRNVHQGEGADRPVTVADLIGLSLWRYMEEKREPAIPDDKQNINWWTLRMVEEDGEVDDDFPPFDRTKPLTSFTTANNRAAGRMRANSRTHDNFGLVMATQAEFAENQIATPQPEEEEEEAPGEEMGVIGGNEESSPRHAPQPNPDTLPAEPRPNPVTNTTYRSQFNMFADAPQAPQAAPNAARGQQRLLRVHLHSTDVAPGQLVTLNVTTETYMAEVLDLVCRKRQLDKANHVLRMPAGGPVILLDAKVQTIGNLSDLELHRRRFATDGPLTMTGSPSSSSPKLLPFADGPPGRKSKKTQMMGSHPLAQEAMKQAELTGTYKSWTVWRLRTVRMMSQSERRLEINGEYVHIKPPSRDGKTTTAHMSQIIGCKLFARHPSQFKLSIYKDTESKRYDFEAKSVAEATEIVIELQKMIEQATS